MNKNNNNSHFGKSYKNLLSEEGEIIYNSILEHCQDMGIADEIDEFELTILANSFDLYSKAAEHCHEHGIKLVFSKDDKKGGAYEQICPEYTVMKNEYSNILKHSSKFGLSPGDRAKLGIKKKKKVGLAEGLD